MKEISYIDAVNNNVFEDIYKKRMVVIIPAHNEESSIGKVLKSISEQKVPEELTLTVFVSLDNCTDNTKKVIDEKSKEYGIQELYCLTTVANKERKVGAMNQIYQLFYGNLSATENKEVGIDTKIAVGNIDCFVCMDADVYIGKDCLFTLWNEANSRCDIGAVSANYTCLIPDNINKIPRSIPNIEDILEHGEYGNSLNRWWVVQQNREFADWTIKQKARSYFAEIAGGQCTLFKREALEEVRSHYKLNGMYDNITDTEDLLLTQYIRAVGWKCLISKSARCYVDSMKKYTTYKAQRIKWVSGTTDYMLMDGLKTKYSRLLWGQETVLFLNLLIRLMLIVLIPLSIATGNFEWNWFWIAPLLLANVLNTIITLKTPNKRIIDIILSLIGISPEIYLWITFYIHIKVWADKLKINKKDGWAEQYKAESGDYENKYLFKLLIILIAVGMVFINSKYNIVNVDRILDYLKYYIPGGFRVLTILTFITSIIMIEKIVKLRGHHKA